MEKIVEATIYGDSIMNGTVMDKQKNQYISIMEENLARFRALFGIQTKNRSRYGLTIDQGQKMLTYDLNKGMRSDFAVVEFGGNDCNFRWNEVAEAPTAEHAPRTRLDTFQEIYLDMITNLKKAGIRPILMTLPPIDAQRYFDFLGRRGNDCMRILKWLGDVQMIYRFHESYSNAIEKIAAKTGELLVDVRSYFLDKHNFLDLICDDGIHPNEEGHKLMFTAFQEFTKQMALA